MVGYALLVLADVAFDTTLPVLFLSRLFFVSSPCTLAMKPLSLLALDNDVCLLAFLSLARRSTFVSGHRINFTNDGSRTVLPLVLLLQLQLKLPLKLCEPCAGRRMHLPPTLSGQGQ